ncbi:MAG: Ldh family oxidoreductase [Candidatus Latescibacteria bacterium]|nr:Ldh family oxidoreductase [Candidatus Latescibacterota bacterium]
MVSVSHDKLRNLSYTLFERVGLPPDEARLISDHLVESSLVGHDSHGIIRLPGYIRSMQQGYRSWEASRVVRETSTTAVIDAGGCHGIVAAYRAMLLAIEKAKAHTFGAVGIHRCGHTGRLGAYPPMAAEAGMIGVVLLNGGSRFTAPFGGTGRRLPPNPISIGVPRKHGPPVLLDITTSVVAGGKVDFLEAKGEQVPEGWMIDREGKSVTDPVRLREEPLAAVLPLGGAFGHKGFGLGFMIDAIAGSLTWAGCSCENPTRGGSGFLVLAIRIEDFIDVDTFTEEVERLTAWVKSSPRLPGVEEIYIPGEIEERMKERRLIEGIPVPEKTWGEIVGVAEELRVGIPEVL